MTGLSWNSNFGTNPDGSAKTYEQARNEYIAQRENSNFYNWLKDHPNAVSPIGGDGTNRGAGNDRLVVGWGYDLGYPKSSGTNTGRSPSEIIADLNAVRSTALTAREQEVITSWKNGTAITFGTTTRAATAQDVTNLNIALTKGQADALLDRVIGEYAYNEWGGSGLDYVLISRRPVPRLGSVATGHEKLGNNQDLTPSLLFSKALCATVQLIYVTPEARGAAAAVNLLRALRRWSAQNKAVDLHINVTTGIEAGRTDRFLRHMGFKQTGGNYVLEGVGG